ncbi:MAG: hypothetical protein ACJ73E_14870, partial [Mycobacteriales bacterium]
MDEFEPGRPVVFRGGTVLPMDDRRSVLDGTDVLVVGERIEAVGPALPVPEGTLEVDAAGGIVMPGMIDTHRHMWQTAMRGYGADWTLTQYFVWYYLEHGRAFRPQDVYAGNLLSAIESLDAGVRGDRRAELAGHLEGGPLREGRVAGDVEGHGEAEHVVARGDPPRHEVAELRPGG